MSPDSSSQTGFQDDDSSGAPAPQAQDLGGAPAVPEDSAAAREKRFKEAEQAWRKVRDRSNTKKAENAGSEDLTKVDVAPQSQPVIDQGNVIDIPEVVSQPVEPFKAEEELGGHVDSPFQDNIQSEFWDILEQAGISKSKFIGFIIGAVVILGVIVYLIFGGRDLFKFDFSFDFFGGDKVEDGRDEPKDLVDRGVVPIETIDRGFGVDDSFVLGLEYNPNVKVRDPLPLGFLGTDVGVAAAFYLGQSYDPDQANFVYYLNFLEKVDSLYQTDVYAFLNQSINRGAALDQLIEEMAAIITESERIVEAIDSQLEVFNEDYILYNEDKVRYENSFFDGIDSLSGTQSLSDLDLFVESGQLALEVRALYNAYSSLLDMYLNALALLKPRYQDIIENREALTRGVRVFDVPESDIEAIIPVPAQEF